MGLVQTTLTTFIIVGGYNSFTLRPWYEVMTTTRCTSVTVYVIAADSSK